MDASLEHSAPIRHVSENAGDIGTVLPALSAQSTVCIFTTGTLE